MTINRRIFFDKIRDEPFRGLLPAATVQGCGAIIDEWERRGLVDLRHLAYMLATARGECGPNMLPVREGFSKSDEAARAFVTRQGYRYAKAVNGQVYYGRGLVQLTWDYNYKKMGDHLGIDLVNHPDEALKPNVAAAIMFEGMIRGSFTGKKLSDYLLSNGRYAVKDKEGRESPELTFRECRRIINGTDKAAQFATWARQFHEALVAASSNAEPPQPPDVEPPAKPPTPQPPSAPAKVGIIATIIAALGTAAAFVKEHPIEVACGLLITGALGVLIVHHRRKP